MSISTISFQLVQIHVILIAFTLPKWMQATASEWALLLQIEFSNFFTLINTQVLSTHSKSKLFYWLPTSFPTHLHSISSETTHAFHHLSAFVHVHVWAITLFSSENTAKALPKHCKALPTHSYCLEITPSLAISLSPFLRPHTPSITHDRLCS